jgi:hypothetical protein
MPGKPKMSVGEYLAQLEETKKGKPPQVKDALGVYIELWDRAVKNGVVAEGDEMGVALSKIDEAGGLYRAAE